ncbi:hypothetical protein NDU88_002483 [Pleurodeles waltl]|uniref:Uncharacterized protein n=1 Tax=Pleurodeles waltl TaxID=8319 RepID=A0AAV7SFD2_PLEWA|nr:hypothetical protein NDU88_002483 [Pleurodeles waltl]
MAGRRKLKKPDVGFPKRSEQGGRRRSGDEGDQEDGESRETEEPCVPIGDRRSGKNWTAVVPIRKRRRNRLREAEAAF